MTYTKEDLKRVRKRILTRWKAHEITMERAAALLMKTGLSREKAWEILNGE